MERKKEFFSAIKELDKLSDERDKLVGLMGIIDKIYPDIKYSCKECGEKIGMWREISNVLLFGRGLCRICVYDKGYNDGWIAHGSKNPGYEEYKKVAVEIIGSIN